jgi:glycosyltransferase involved in cell wall biosynthesis
VGSGTLRGGDTASQEDATGEGESPGETGDSPLHILVLADRDWAHPQGGGTATNLFAQVSRWLDWGHRVTVLACGYPGAPATERIGRLTIHRFGGRSTVFPRVIWRQWRGLVPDADVVLEIINGITFLTPLWLRTPRVVLIHHIHRRHYFAELGRLGSAAAVVLETLPLRLLYRNARFLSVSKATAEDIADHGIPLHHIAVNHNGVEPDAFFPGTKSPEPTILFLGRLKKYKRVELILDAMTRVGRGTLDIAGDGDHRPAVESAVVARGLQTRVRFHGPVDEATKLRLLQRSWIHVTASECEGWGLTVTEAAACGTPTVAIACGGLAESVVHGETGTLVEDADGLADAIQALVEDGVARDRLGQAAVARSRGLTWDHTARSTLSALQEERSRATTDAVTAHERLAGGHQRRAGGSALTVLVADALQLTYCASRSRVAARTQSRVRPARFLARSRRDGAPAASPPT